MTYSKTQETSSAVFIRIKEPLLAQNDIQIITVARSDDHGVRDMDN